MATKTHDTVAKLGLELGTICRAMMAFGCMGDEEQMDIAMPSGVCASSFEKGAWYRINELRNAILAMPAKTLDGAMAQLVAAYHRVTDLEDDDLSERERKAIIHQITAAVFSIAAVLEAHGARSHDDFDGAGWCMSSHMNPFKDVEDAAGAMPQLQPYIDRHEREKTARKAKPKAA